MEYFSLCATKLILMKKQLLTSLLVFLFPLTAHMTDCKIPQSEVDNTLLLKYKRIMNLEQKVNSNVDYNMLFNIPIISPIHRDAIHRISDLFGIRKCHPVYKIPSFHSGIDFSAKLGTPVLSTANGIVVDVKYSKKGYGNKVIIEHDNNYRTLYAHLSDIHVSIGDTIDVGEELGTVGNSGLSTGPHLHYEIQYNGLAIDPLSLYQIDLEKEDKVNDYLAFLSDFESVVDSNT